MPMLESIPDRVRQCEGFPHLAAIVNDIYECPALCLQGVALGNMIQASLLFTVCFQRNLTALLEHAASEMRRNMETDGERLLLVMKLCLGELTDEVRAGSETESPYGPHFVWMLRAAKEAGIPTAQTEQLVEYLRQGVAIGIACEQAGFSSVVASYFEYSEACCASYLRSLATISGREHVLAETFTVILGNLPADCRLEVYRDFLKGHIHLDRDNPEDPHSDIVSRLLDKHTSEELRECLQVMNEFFRRRYAVYTACLEPGGLFKEGI